MTASGPLERVASVVAAVTERALRDRGLTRIALLDDGGPEARLARRLLEPLGERLVAVGVRHDDGEDARIAEERRRFRARLLDDALVAHPASKTVLLLSASPPPEPLLPLGDLWASEVEALEGDCSAPAEIAELAAAAGGFGPLDAALRALVDERDAKGLSALGAPLADRVAGRIAAGAAARRWPWLVPKLGPRTFGVDLFE